MRLGSGRAAKAEHTDVGGQVESAKPVVIAPTLLTDNGSGYISRAMADFLRMHGLRHVRASAHHPQTLGKLERLHRTLKDDVTLVVETTPDALRAQIARFVDYYNRERYHEALSCRARNACPRRNTRFRDGQIPASRAEG